MIPLFVVHMPPREELLPSLEKVLYEPAEGLGYVNVGQGPQVEEFEAALARFIGNKNLLTVNSGTSALELALKLIGVKDGSVVSTPMTCMATNTPIIAEGARIIWADIDPASGNIDPLDVERKIASDTKAIMAVHWGGVPCDLDALNSISQRYGIPLIEDAAHALGATWRGRRIGNQTADFTAFSTQAIKHITTIDGGFLTVKNSADYRRGKLLRWYGIDRETERKDFRCEDDVIEAGMKWHMNDVNAVVGLAQLPYLEEVLAQHRENAAWYLSHLAGVVTPTPPVRSEPAWWLYTIQLRDASERRRFMEHMKARGVAVSQVHARNDLHTCFREFKQSPLPGVDEFTDRMVCIPVHWKVGERERKQVVAGVASFFTEGRFLPTLDIARVESL